MKSRVILASALLLIPAGCATAIPSAEVTRFHLDQTPMSGTVAVEEMLGNQDVSLEFKTYAAAVGQELQRIGFTEQAGKDSEYVALVSFRRAFRSPNEALGNDKPVSVSVGGSTGSYGSGLGVGIGINLAGKPKDIVTTELYTQIRRRSDQTTMWEGRATTEAREGTPASQPGLAAAKLASALFRDFPGQSGVTIRVK